MKKSGNNKTIVLCISAFFILSLFVYILANKGIFVKRTDSNNLGPTVELSEINASSTILHFVIIVNHLPQVRTIDDFDNLICDPYIEANDLGEMSISSKEGKISSSSNDPLIITYEYNIAAKKGQKVIGKINFTIGPCGNYGYNEINKTPLPPADLIGNYVLDFETTVQ
jgi:hypothetical protein